MLEFHTGLLSIHAMQKIDNLAYRFFSLNYAQLRQNCDGRLKQITHCYTKLCTDPTTKQRHDNRRTPIVAFGMHQRHSLSHVYALVYATFSPLCNVCQIPRGLISNLFVQK